MNGTEPVFYNDNEPFACAWLRELIKAGHLPQGDVSEKSIQDLRGSDFEGYRHIHLFAGIGGWPLALKLAGWPEDREVLSGSCPCQPWSDANVAAGGGKGYDDDRHLWPEMFRIVCERRPATIFSEQVVGAIKKHWLDGVFSQLESIGYACGAAIMPAIGYGGRHQRKRIFFVADSRSQGWERYQQIERISESEREALPVNGDSLARASSALDGDYGGLRPYDGLSVVMERHAIKCYGNAIVPPVAAEFIRAFLEAEADSLSRSDP